MSRNKKATQRRVCADASKTIQTTRKDAFVNSFNKDIPRHTRVSTATTAPLEGLLDLDHTEQFLRVLCPDDWDARTYVWSFYPESDECTEVRPQAFVATWEDAPRKIEIFLHGNPRGAVAFHPNEANGTKKADVASMAFIRLDFDGGGDLPDWFPEPTALVQSYPPQGNRLHLYYNLTEPEAVALVLDVQRALCLAFDGGDQSALNANRGLRLPGTPHRKCATPDKGQKYPEGPAMCRMVKSNAEARYTLDSLLNRIPADKLNSKAIQDIGLGKPCDALQGDLRRVDGKVLQEAVHIIKTHQAAISGDPQHGGGRPLFCLAGRLHRGCKMPLDQVDALLREHYNSRCVPPWDFTNAEHRKSWDRAITNGVRLYTATAVGAYLKNTVSWPSEVKPIKVELPSVPRFEDFSAALFPDVFASYVLDEAARMPCPADYVAASLLVAMGSVIGCRCAVRPKRHDPWKVIPNLWGTLIGLVSSKKSPSLEKGMVGISHLEAIAAKEYAEDIKAYARTKRINEAKLKGLQSELDRSVRPQTSTRTKNNNTIQDPELIVESMMELEAHVLQEPKIRRFKTNDGTIEKIGELLSSSPYGMMALRDELSGFMAYLEREGHQSDRSFYLEAWNGDKAYTFDRIIRGTVVIENLCLSIMGGIQPDKLWSYLNETRNGMGNDGFIQRFQVMVFPDPCPWAYVDRPPEAGVKDHVCDLFESFASFEPTMFGASSTEKIPSFGFSDAANQVFVAWQTEMNTIKIKQEDNPVMRQHLGKYDKLFCSIALLMHILECVEHPNFEGLKTGEVSEAAARRAAAWCSYLEHHARRVYGLLIGQDQQSALALSVWLQRGRLKDGFTARDVQRNDWQHLTTKEHIAAALDWLVDAGWLQQVMIETGGRPSVTYLINPNIPPETLGL